MKTLPKTPDESLPYDLLHLKRLKVLGGEIEIEHSIVFYAGKNNPSGRSLKFCSGISSTRGERIELLATRGGIRSRVGIGIFLVFAWVCMCHACFHGLQ
jgi:hypothetical protein